MATWQESLFQVLKKSSVKLVSYVPDAGHAHLIARAHQDESMRAVALTTEEEGVAFACGAALGGQRAVLLMQSSGVGNCINMFSLLSAGRFPFLTLITMRGEWGEFNPWQVPMGKATPSVLQAMDLPVPAPPVIAGRPLQAVLAGGAPEPPAVSEISHRGFVAHGMRTSRDKYIQRFSPEEDELYFDLAQDPKETTSRLDQAGERVRFLKGGIEAAMTPNPFRHTLRFEGADAFEVRLKTRGWIEGVQPVGFGVADRYEIEGNGRKLHVKVQPRPGQPREIAFGIRPMGAPVQLEGTRRGRPLAPADVLIAQEAVHPAAVPFALPEIETEKERVENIFAPPPAGRAGLHVWLAMIAGKKPPAVMDRETCERLKALGYIDGDCPAR